MKRSFRILTLACMAMSLFASCSKEPNDPNGGNQPGPEPDKTFEYVFTLNEAALTKTTLGDDAISFEEGDKLGIMVQTPEKTTTTSAEVYFTESETNVAFEITQQKGIEKGGKVHAWYPFAEATAQAALCIPAEQQQNEATYDADAMPLVSTPFEATATLPTGRKHTAGELTMAAVGAIAEFEVYSTFPGFTDQQILSVEWTAEGLAGNFTWDFASENPSLGTLTGNSAKTTVNTTESVAATKQDAAKIYMVVAPGQHAGAIKVKTTEAEYTLTLAEALTLEPGSVTPIEVNLENTTWNVAKTYRYRFAATSADNLFGTLSQPVGFFAGEENLEKTLAEGAFTYDRDEALAAGAAVYAYYPYNAEATAANALALSIPATQTNTAEGGFDASYIPVVAAPVTVEGIANQQEVNGTFQFHSLASVVKFNVYSAYAATTGEKVTSLKLDAEGIAGNFTWDLTAERSEWTVSGLDANSVLASPAAPAAIGADAENAAVVYAVVAPGIYTGTLTVTTDNTTYEIALGQKTFAIAETVEVEVELPSSSNGFGATLEDFEITEMVTKFSEESTIELYGADKEKVTLSYSEEGFKAESQVKGPYYAIYPEGAGSVNFNNGSFNGVVAAEQTLSEGKNIAEGAFAYFAMSNNPVLTFKNATSLVKVAVANENVTAITLKAGEGQTLAGEYTLAITEDGASVAAVEGKGSQTVTLKPAGETFPKGEYYLAVLPGATEGLSVEFTIGEDKVTKTKTIETIARNSAKDLGLFLGYNIANAEQLLAWNNDNKNWTKWDVVTLTDNIDCAGVITSDNWTLRRFTGTLDGNYKSITNFAITKEGPAAMIGMMAENAIAKNLTFGEGCSFTSIAASDGTLLSTGRVYAAALTCETKDAATFENIVNYGSITGNHGGTANKGNYIGGIASSIQSTGVFSNCKNYGAITFSAAPNVWTNVGGVFGEISKTVELRACENHGHVMFNGPSSNGASINLAGITGGALYASFTDCKNLGTVENKAQAAGTGNVNIGGFIGHHNQKAAKLGIITNCVNGSSIDATKGNLINSGPSKSELHMGGFIGYLQEACSNVSGFTNYGSITNTASVGSWCCIGGVVGLIKDLNKTADQETNTISGCNNYGHLETTVATNRVSIGGAVGFIDNSNTSVSTIKNYGNIANKADAGSGVSLGGAVGRIQAHKTAGVNSITSCENEGDITFAGKCINDASMSSGIGGIIGIHAGAVNKVTTTKDNITTTSYYHFKSILTITGCTNKGTVEKTGAGSNGFHLGGIAGTINSTYNDNAPEDKAEATITNCSNSGYIHNASSGEAGAWTYTGGIVGYQRCKVGDISNCTNSGNITNSTKSTAGAGGIRVGGIAGGGDQPTFSNCSNTGTIKDDSASKNTELGGICGRFTPGTKTTVTKCENSGEIICATTTGEGVVSVGGIVGKAQSPTEFANCFNKTGSKLSNSNTAVTTEYIGGIIGYNNGKTSTMKNCGSSSEISAKSQAYSGLIAGNIGAGSSVTETTVSGTFNKTTLDATNFGTYCFGTSSGFKTTDGVTLAE